MRESPLHARATSSANYSTHHNAIRAKVQLQLAAQNQVQLECPEGAKKGLANLLDEFDTGMHPRAWVQQAVSNVVVQSSPSAVGPARTALRWYAEFADEVLDAKGVHLPPSPQGLAAWSLLFRRAETYANYIAYLRLGCEIFGL